MGHVQNAIVQMCMIACIYDQCSHTNVSRQHRCVAEAVHCFNETKVCVCSRHLEVLVAGKGRCLSVCGSFVRV